MLKEILSWAMTLLTSTVRFCSHLGVLDLLNNCKAPDAGSHYGAIPGRYANRIGNATFTVDGVTYHTEQNDGSNTLHSGTNGWGFRHWNVTAVSTSSITFSIVDPDMSTNMPGTVYGKVTYTLSKKKWSIKIAATSPEKKTRMFQLSLVRAHILYKTPI